MVVRIGQKRWVVLVALSVWERGHWPTNIVIVKTSRRVLVDQ
jgi:hypothetical protein